MSGRFSHRFARLILRYYPPAWQRRYADEMRALLDDAPSDGRRLADLSAGAVREWVRPGYHAWPTMSDIERTKSAYIFNCVGIALLIQWSARLIASALDRFEVAVPAGAERVQTILVGYVVVRLAVIVHDLLRNNRRVKRGLEKLPPLTLKAGEPIALACLALVAGVLHHASPVIDAAGNWILYVHSSLYAFIVCTHSARMARLQRMHRRAAKRHERLLNGGESPA